MSSPVDRHVGKKLKDLRRLRACTLAELASRMGLTYEEIQNIELGRSRFKGPELTRVARVLAVSPNYFFEGFAASARMADLKVSVWGSTKVAWLFNQQPRRPQNGNCYEFSRALSSLESAE